MRYVRYIYEGLGIELSEIKLNFKLYKLNFYRLMYITL